MRYLILLLFFANLACQKYEEIIGGLTQREANIILLALKQNNIDAEKIAHKELKTSSFAIEVSKKDITEALKIIIDNQLPQDLRISFKDIYSLANNSLIPSKMEEEARFLMAQQGEIESLLKVLPTVMDAKVVLSIDNKEEFLKTHSHKTASVILVLKPHSIDTLSQEEVKKIVSASIVNLNEENISVIIKPALALNFTSIEEKKPVISVSKNILFDNIFLAVFLITIFLSMFIAVYGIKKIFWPKIIA
jgi:flagellar M-ring protein FliF